MAGYHNYSMSNNAKDCYDSGIMPISKWTKQDIFDGLKDYDLSAVILIELEKLNLYQLKKVCLIQDSWHHTSSYFNKTDFYKINPNIEDLTIDELKEQIELYSVLKKQTPTQAKARCRYLVWSGTRKHPKATECESIGTIKGDWFYLPDGSKKKTTAKGFKVLEYISD